MTVSNKQQPSQVLQQYNVTCLCGTCYKELLGTVEYRADGGAYLTKSCSVHGYEEAMIEQDWKFFEQSKILKNHKNDYLESYNDTTAIEITDRCNLKCPHCYHNPDNSVVDQEKQLIVQRALSTATDWVCLMGAEPTMREDLPEIIKEIKKAKWKNVVGKKKVTIYTNGVKISNKQYLQTLIDAGLDGISVSIHHKDYHNEKIWENTQKTLNNLVNSKIGLGQVSFTIESKEELGEVLDVIQYMLLKNKKAWSFSIRTPQTIGVDFTLDKEIFTSELNQWLFDLCKQRKIPCKPTYHYGTPYFYSIKIFNKHEIALIHWPNSKSLITSFSKNGPWAKFIPNTTGTFIIQAILRDGWKHGWWQGQRLINIENIKK